MKCKICGSNNHYCSSCGTITEYDYEVCFDCWEKYEIGTKYYELYKKIDDLLDDEFCEWIDSLVKKERE
jgi:hypothetical protein